MNFNNLVDGLKDNLGKMGNTTTTTTDNTQQPQQGGEVKPDQAGVPTGGQQQQAPNTANQQDYVDKGFAQAVKRSGYNIDANSQEKITDAARGMYEKATGSKVDSKYSN